MRKSRLPDIRSRFLTTPLRITRYSLLVTSLTFHAGEAILTGRERTAEILHAIYRELLGQYGAQKWWPLYTGSAWEIMIGAVLTQHTTWSNVELALNNILSVWGPEGLSRPEMMLEAQTETLAVLVRPAGFYTAKPLKLQNLARFVVERGGLEQFAASPESTENLRTELLGVWGIGP